MQSIEDIIKEFGAKNLLVMMPGKRLHDAGFVTYTTNDDMIDWCKFKIDEQDQRYSYKVSFKSTDPQVASERFYTSDFDTLRSNEPSNYRIFLLDSDGFSEIKG